MSSEDIIIRCQSIARCTLVRRKLINNKIINKLRNNPKIMENCFLEIKKILYLFPPAKNENKFIYGKVGELCLINNINKNTKDTHSINGLHFIICNIEDKCLYIFTHSEKFEMYVENSGANISYKGSIITELRKHPEYIYHFPNTKKIENYREDTEIQPYEYIYNTFIKNSFK